MRERVRSVIYFTGIIAVYLGFTTYRLRQLPGDWYGDISIEHREVLAILAGYWPWRFNLSAGPAYHYVVAAFAGLLGPNYTTYKIASLVTGLAAVLVTYLLGKELGGRLAGLLASLVAAMSFWLVVFARLGSSPQILTPLLSAGAVYFLLRFSHTWRLRHMAASMLFAVIGLFTYPATFILPLVILALVAWHLLFPLPLSAASQPLRPRRAWWRPALLSVGILLPFAAVFGYMTVRNPDFTQGGYVGGKVLERGVSPADELRTFGKNMITTLEMFQWTGDRSFRTSDSGKPLLDPLSGGLMAAGLLAVFLDPRLRGRWPYLVVPILLLVMPSANPGIPPMEIPSSSRTLGAAPFVFVLVALGLEAVWAGVYALLVSPEQVWPGARAWLRSLGRAGRSPGEFVPVTGPAEAAPGDSRAPQQAPVSPPSSGPAGLIAGLVLAVLLVVIGVSNASRYFGDYAWGLPEHNQAWGWQIARYIDAQPQGVVVKMAACCWGKYQDPDPESIYYVLKHSQGRQDFLAHPYVRGCEDLQPAKTYLIIFPPKENSTLLADLRACIHHTQGEIHTDGLGASAFYTLIVR